MRILLGGIPLGCDNIGDEAIIACVVQMLKESIPGVELTVATADPATAGRLGVSVAPLYGFMPEYPIHNSSLVALFSRYGPLGLSPRGARASGDRARGGDPHVRVGRGHGRRAEPRLLQGARQAACASAPVRPRGMLRAPAPRATQAADRRNASPVQGRVASRSAKRGDARENRIPGRGCRRGHGDSAAAARATTTGRTRYPRTRWTWRRTRTSSRS